LSLRRPAASLTLRPYPTLLRSAGFGNHVAGRALAPRGTGSGSRETTPPDVPSLEGPVVEVRSLGGGRRSPGAWRRRLTGLDAPRDRKSTRLNSSHVTTSSAVFF